MKWIKKGHIFTNLKDSYWNQSHAQVPTAIILNEKIRIYYCTRDKYNRSLTTFIDVNKNNPNEILKIKKNPILELGKAGTFDDSGIMPTWVLENKGEIYLFYVGWNTGGTARYRVAHGLAISRDNGETFEKYSNGPILDRSLINPISVSNNCIMKDGDIWKMWYMSYTKWEKHSDMFEPYYVIKYAESEDLIKWNITNKICIDLKDGEGGIARPCVIKDDNLYKMWYSYRNKEKYRINKNASYRIGYAVSTDGLKWNRKDEFSGIGLSKEGWDSEMIAYPNIIDVKDKRYMFYNGNGFGKSGFGYAEIEKNENIDS